MSRDELVQQLLALSPEDRFYVMNAVEAAQPLLFDGFASEEIRREVMAELEDRIQAYESGEMPAEDWQVVMARLRANLEERRANKAMT